jgi:hypothetical protein
MHTIAYLGSVNSATLVALNVIADDILSSPQANRFQVPADLNAIHGAASLGATLARAQIQAPSLEVKRASLEVIPHEAGTVAFTLGAPRLFVPKREVALSAPETLMFYTNNAAGGADNEYGIVWLRKPGEIEAMPAGDIITCRATSATTLVANAWTTCTMALDKDLPAGQYGLVGFLPVSATGIVARALITGQTYRPGVPVLAGTEAAARDFDPGNLQDFLWYKMGEFANITIPQFQFLATAGDVAEVVILYLVKIA